MKTIIEEQDGKFVATLEGELDTVAALEVEKALEPLYENTGKDIVFECKKLEYIASSGLRILLTILKNAKENGSEVILRNWSDNIKDVFNLTGFVNIFHFE